MDCASRSKESRSGDFCMKLCMDDRPFDRQLPVWADQILTTANSLMKKTIAHAEAYISGVKKSTEKEVQENVT